jgi:hypothetical protein
MNAEELLTQMVEIEHAKAWAAKVNLDNIAEAETKQDEDQFDRIRDLVGADKAADIYDIIEASKEKGRAVFNQIMRAHSEKIAVLDEQKASLQREVEPLILERSASVKVPGIQAVYTAGRVTWDSKTLDGFAMAHPEIAKARKVGKPSVSYRFDKE